MTLNLNNIVEKKVEFKKRCKLIVIIIIFFWYRWVFYSEEEKVHIIKWLIFYYNLIFRYTIYLVLQKITNLDT